MAMACADGKTTNPIDIDSASWVEKYNTVHPYTKEEENMLQSAMKTVPTDHHSEVSDRRSLEPNDTHKISPVKGFKGY
jgi:carbonic anhydrase